jgi:hypothetical protein
VIGNPAEAVMAGSLFIVSATTPGIYTYLKLTNKSGDAVILDRRKVDRRRSHQGMTPERRNGERRHRNVMTDLQKYGWVLVHR